MSGADYYHCPVCEKKALYDADEYGVGQADVEVLHRECLAKDRAERERAVREQIAQELETVADRECDGSAWDHGMTAAIEIVRAGLSVDDTKAVTP